MNRRFPIALVAALAVPTLCLTSCAGQKLLGKVAGTQQILQEAIEDGSKVITCAPKETAIAEANIKFAQDALAMGEYFRGKEHAETAEIYTAIARKKTDPIRCKGTPVDKPPPGVNDKDNDGYDEQTDTCPDDPEDFDSFEDDDGCPDKDNDGDGVLDAAELTTNEAERTYEWSNNDKKTLPNGGVSDCRNEPEDVDGFEDEDGCPDPDNDNDKIIDADDTCKNDPEDFDGHRDDDGCPDRDNDGDGYLDAAELKIKSDGTYEWTNKDGKMTDEGKWQDCRDTPENFNGKEDNDGCPEVFVINGCKLELNDKIYFKFNKWDIDPRSYGLLDQVVETMNVFPTNKFYIDGHTDSKGSNKYNKKLSQKRVDSVKTYLVGKGIDTSRLTPRGFGEEQPIDTNKTSEGRAANRRVEFNLQDCKKIIK